MKVSKKYIIKKWKGGNFFVEKNMTEPKQGQERENGRRQRCCRPFVWAQIPVSAFAMPANVESAHLCSAEEMKKAKAAYRDRLDLHSGIFGRFALYWTRNLNR